MTVPSRLSVFKHRGLCAIGKIWREIFMGNSEVGRNVLGPRVQP